MSKCPWCLDPNATEENNLCRTHQAECDGLSVSELDRMEREQYAEWLDAVDWHC